MSQTLLLADDSVTIQRVIELTFADEGVDVIAVGDGQEAIERIRTDPPDIVLADTSMPERDGYQVAAFVKADPALAHIPVVLLTGAFEPIDERRAREAGCDAVLVKPFEPQLVIRRVRELLAPRPAVSVDAAPISPDPAPISPDPAPISPDAAPISPDPAPISPDPATGAGSSNDAGSGPAQSAGGADRTTEKINVEATKEVSPVSTAAKRPGLSKPVVSTDDPLGTYLNRIDEAFDLLEEEPPPASPRAVPIPAPPTEAPVSDASPSPMPETDAESLDGALSALEGALETLTLDALEEIGSQGGDVPAARSAVAPSLPTLSAVPRLTEPPDVEPTAPSPFPATDTREASEPASAPTGALEAERPVEVARVELPAPARTPPEPEEALPEVTRPPLDDGQSAATLPSASPPAPPPTLADAFASLLAAEQGDPARGQTTSPRPRPVSPAGISEELIERVTERVIARLSGGVPGGLVAEVVSRVAERLVREEIERIKQV